MPTFLHVPFAAIGARALLAALCGTALVAQDEGKPRPKPEEPHFVVRRYPQDRDVAIAVVGSRSLTLGDLVDHIDEMHQPGFRTLLEQRPEYQRMLQSDLIAPWVRHFADLEALRQTATEPIDDKKLVETQSAALKTSFQEWLDKYTAGLREAGRPTELSQQRVNSLLQDFQTRNGLGAELQGFLNYLEPDTYTRGQMQDFFQDNARYFGGRVNIEHILVQHRDGGTGILLKDEGVARANARLADIKARLKSDGSNFAEVARLFSEDTKTAPDGGTLKGIARFDDRLPAALCRAAWALDDGQVSGIVESQYGFHILKRTGFDQQVFILFSDDAIPSIRTVMHRAKQEERLFTAREKAKVQLKL